MGGVIGAFLGALILEARCGYGGCNPAVTFHCFELDEPLKQVVFVLLPMQVRRRNPGLIAVVSQGALTRWGWLFCLGIQCENG